MELEFLELVEVLLIVGGLLVVEVELEYLELVEVLLMVARLLVIEIQIRIFRISRSFIDGGRIMSGRRGRIVRAKRGIITNILS